MTTPTLVVICSSPEMEEATPTSSTEIEEYFDDGEAEETEVEESVTVKPWPNNRKREECQHEIAGKPLTCVIPACIVWRQEYKRACLYHSRFHDQILYLTKYQKDTPRNQAEITVESLKPDDNLIAAIMKREEQCFGLKKGCRTPNIDWAQWNQLFRV